MIAMMTEDMIAEDVAVEEHDEAKTCCAAALTALGKCSVECDRKARRDIVRALRLAERRMGRPSATLFAVRVSLRDAKYHNLRIARELSQVLDALDETA